jgi:ring-1,2-phenylacetyl-CoA epoxidase subunit PaaD
MQPSDADVMAWLSDIQDPEIPVLSIVDLGIVRGFRCSHEDAEPECVVTVTPTYSGCPATEVIARTIRDVLAGHGIDRIRVETRISPAWTTDWLGDDARRKLKDYGIAPPPAAAIAVSAIGRGPRAAPRAVACPLCGSERTELTSQFGSTPCKALYRCLACLEPFDFFKCH